MEHLTTRTGGESETQAGKLIPSFVIDTAGAPATEREGAAAAPEWIGCRAECSMGATAADHFELTIRQR
jgi:hypothetical protein